MQWEIILAVILAIGIVLAIKEFIIKKVHVGMIRNNRACSPLTAPLTSKTCETSL